MTGRRRIIAALVLAIAAVWAAAALGVYENSQHSVEHASTGSPTTTETAAVASTTTTTAADTTSTLRVVMDPASPSDTVATSTSLPARKASSAAATATTTAQPAWSCSVSVEAEEKYGQRYTASIRTSQPSVPVVFQVVYTAESPPAPGEAIAQTGATDQQGSWTPSYTLPAHRADGSAFPSGVTWQAQVRGTSDAWPRCQANFRGES